MRSAGIRSNVECGVSYDKVFVPQYEQRVPGNGGVANPPTPSLTLCNRSDFCSASGVRAGLVEKGGRSSGLLLPPSSSSPRSGLQGLLHGNAQTPHPPWPVLVSAYASSSASAVDSVSIGPQQFQQSWSGMYRKLSEFQIALRASEKAREDGEKETQALRLYVSNVETAAAGLVARVQDLENLLALSTAFRQGLDAEQLRGKVATEALKEAQKQATAAAQSIAVAREATMELDKVKRETNAWAVAQEAEIERLNMEAAECRMLCKASSKMIQDLRIQIANLQRQPEHQNATIEDSQKTLQIEAGAYQKKYEEAKFAVIEKADQCDELMQALELSTAVGKAAELKLEELLAEKKEMTQKNEFLEQQVKELKSQDHGAAAVQYEQQLRRARNALEDEKAQLLDDLAQLRRSNQNWTEEMKANWHEKQGSASMIYSSSDPLQHTTSDAHILIADVSNKPGVLRSKVESHTLASTSPSKESCSYNYSQEEVEKGRLSVASSASASGSWRTETSGTKDCNHRPDVMWSQSSSSDCSSSKEARQQSHCGTATATCGKLPDARSQFQSPGAAASEALESSGDENTRATVLAFKELTLLAAAQHEIMKLKEINEQLVAACQ